MKAKFYQVEVKEKKEIVLPTLLILNYNFFTYFLVVKMVKEFFSLHSKFSIILLNFPFCTYHLP